MDFCIFQILLYGFPAWLIYSLLGFVVKQLTPPPPPEVKARWQDARAKVRQALADVERHNRGEDSDYWGDSDIDRLDMALAEASEIRYDPLSEYFPWWAKGIISLNLAKGLVDLTLRLWLYGKNGFREFQDWMWIAIQLGIGILLFLIPLFTWYVEGRKKA